MEYRDDTIRPASLTDFIGQDELRNNLHIYISSAKSRTEPLDHILFYGNPGLGKTTLAQIMASELGVNIVTTTGPVLEKSGDLAAIITSLNKHDILFIDEIHRMPVHVEEFLYPAMEDFSLDIITGQGPGARVVKITLEPFTLVGATTRLGLLSSPLRDRFGIISRLELYSPENLAAIAKRSAEIYRISIEEKACLEIGKRSRGTPRIANRLLRRIRDFAIMESANHITYTITKNALALMEIDEEGLDSLDRKLLSTIVRLYNGGPVGLKTLAIACGEDSKAIEDIYEPFLIQSGFIQRTPRGRIATAKTLARFS
ncbi:MAG: Holliday junction branch migration DNA helicase RuvB [Desulfovibrionaceae bacterium]